MPKIRVIKEAEEQTKQTKPTTQTIEEEEPLSLDEQIKLLTAEVQRLNKVIESHIHAPDGSISFRLKDLNVSN